MDLDDLTQTWSDLLSNPTPGVRRLALRIDDVAVGWSGFGAPREPGESRLGELHALNLLPDYWSQGLGSQLFRASVDGLAQMGYAKAYLWVADGNARAISFYEGHGWALDGQIKDDLRFAPPLRELRMAVGIPHA